MSIVALSQTHKSALQIFLEDFDAASEANIPGYCKPRDWTHQRILRALADETRVGEHEGRMPCTTRFYEDRGQLLGLYNIRHYLNEPLRSVGGHVGYSVRPSARGRGIATRLLSAAKSYGRELGLDSLTLTCDVSNLASVRVIEKNGGRLRDTYFHERAGGEILRFDLPTGMGT